MVKNANKDSLSQHTIDRQAMASDRCKCTLGARSFIYCIHHIKCEAKFSHKTF